MDAQSCSYEPKTRASMDTSTASSSNPTVTSTTPSRTAAAPSASSTTCRLPVRWQSVTTSLVVLLVVALSTAPAVQAAPARDLAERSRLYASLMRAVENELANPMIEPIRRLNHERRRRRSTAPSKRAEPMAYDKKSYPRICYFSPIQCLFTRMSLRK